MPGEKQDSEILALAALVREVQNGDRKAWRGIIERTHRNLLKIAFLVVGRKEVAEDLCQDAYIKALNAVSSLKEPEKIMAWLCRILKNLWLIIVTAYPWEALGLCLSFIKELASNSTSPKKSSNP